MINKKLVNTVPKSKKYIAWNVALQWIALLANVVFICTVVSFIELLYELLYWKIDTQKAVLILVGVTVVTIIIRMFCSYQATKMAYLASKEVKQKLRAQIYQKLLRLGAGYNKVVNTSEIVQVTVEGTQQLETYFGAYLPQFFYSMLAPFTLFVVLSFISLKTAVVLLVCVPLIPILIALIQTWAKKLLSKYWGQYTALGDSFLENLQGLTTLKIYNTDDIKNQEMNQESEKFRKVTMRVLTMQLNSITIMDLVAYGGSALGIILAIKELMAGNIDFGGALIIILIAADFFIPMRQLGSYFHIAMNGMAAWKKIDRILNLPEKEQINKVDLNSKDFSWLEFSDVHFSYEPEREILKGVNIKIDHQGLIGIVGESGSGKSTVAGILRGVNQNYSGHVQVNGVELHDITEKTLMQNITAVTHNSYLFKGTVRDNLLMGNPQATDEMMLQVLRRMKLVDFVMNSGGLDMPIAEKGQNISGGQAQRLVLARALLHESPVYIFDEATSNIDVESEQAILDEITRLAQEKIVIMISHRLANFVKANQIFVLHDGRVVEEGTHEKLITSAGKYHEIWQVQERLEKVGLEEDA
ncbi:ABC transporter ATP-binding protein/permease [Ligilactobacillus ceti]|uniref:Multidrug resistance protein 1 n=1 Tax=Ligilactobacillus ceti DSM 22408 TaxID=1122146 RepID=A0A0R2KM77_9LACO|nr:ATP-binding cassette domain-containing protein [Ligilactobacillus ceti]KRN90542.1 multidrug resistance protein 1 [Ligilactobacillus ceti DSM 22408]